MLMNITYWQSENIEEGETVFDGSSAKLVSYDTNCTVNYSDLRSRIWRYPNRKELHMCDWRMS